MGKVYIISQFQAESKADQDFNISIARHYAKQVAYEGNIPVVPQLYYTQFLDDRIDGERKLGLALGLRALTDCNEFLLVIVDGIISRGMKSEIAEASRLGLQGRVVTLSKTTGKELVKVVV